MLARYADDVGATFYAPLRELDRATEGEWAALLLEAR